MQFYLRLAIAPVCALFCTLGYGGVSDRVTTSAALTYSRLPLAFEKHREIAGVGNEVFIARGQNYSITLEKGKAKIGLMKAKDDPGRVVSLEFAGAEEVPGEAGEPLAGKINYIRGADSRRWLLGMSTYSRIAYSGIYPGIDVVYYGNQEQLEFDLVVRPGGNPEDIRMKIGGGAELSIGTAGELRIGDSHGDLSIALPTIYQEIAGKRVAVAGRYAIRGDEVAFLVSRYDHGKPLVIDPTIVYSTLLNGGNSSSVGFGIALDGSGNILVAGYTYASDFPTSNSLQGGLKAGPDGFVSKISADGSTLLYSTYMGGSSSEYFQGVAVDSKGAAWVVGSSYSNDFPLLNPIQATNGGGSDAVIAKLSATGALLFSTYLGSTNFDIANGVAVDSADNAYITGSTSGGSFPTTSGALLTVSGGNTDAFVVKFDTTGKRLYSTLLGGASDDFGQAIASDTDGSAYITGYTYSNSFAGAPSTGAQVSNAGVVNAFVAKLNPVGTTLQYFTFLGGAGYDQGLGIVVDGAKSAYLVGQTSSTGIATAGAAQTSIADGSHGFAAKLNPAGSTFNYITYIGGNRQDYLKALAVDSGGNVYLGGNTDSTGFPIGSAVQPTANGNVVSLSRTSTSASTWAAFDTLLPGAVYDLSVNPANGVNIVASTEAGIYRSLDGGASWKSAFAQGFPAANYLGRSIAAPTTVYLANYNNIYRSQDDGATWTYMGNSPYQATGIVADPLTATTAYIFANTSPSIYKSTDGGVTWTLASTGLSSSAASRPQTMVATKDGSLYVGFSSFGGVYKSTNQGNSWSAANGSVGSLTVNAHSLSASANTLYFAAGALYKTTDGGSTWTATSSIANAGSISVSPLDATSLYVGTYSNTVVSSGDGGGTFGVAGAGLPTTFDYRTSGIVVHPTLGATAYVVNPIVKPAFVLKLNSTGTAFSWFTYLSGSASSFVYGLATNRAGEVFATGYSGGGGFPVTATHLQSGTFGAFITRISDATGDCSTLSVSPNSSTLSSTGGIVSLNVLAPSGCTWSTSSDQVWAAITDGASGSGSGLIAVQVAANASGTSRVATFTVGKQTATVSQADASCVFALDKSSYPLPSAGGSVSAILSVGSSCPWSVANNYGIVKIVSGASGSGPGTIGLSVSANVGAGSRVFSLAVGSAVINIVQSTPSVTIATTLLPLGSPGTAYSAQLNARGGTAPYSGWVVGSGALPAGLSLDSASGIISGNPTTISGSATQFSITVTDSLGTVSNTAALSISVVSSIPALGVSVSHVGNFAQSQPGAEYRALVQNNGSAPTAGIVTSSIVVPAGLSVTSIAGTGWTCGTGRCSRNDALPVGASYPVITFTVNVAANAVSPLTTKIAVVGGGASDTSAEDQTIVVGALTDTVPSDYFFTAVNLLREYGITGGCSASPPQYCPNDNVTRAQMAFFIVRTIAGGDNFTFSPTPYFTDVSAADFGFKWIQKMYELGITAGCGSGKYCPADVVTRGQMAIFVIRARLGAASDNTFTFPAMPSFDDVPATALYFKWIQRMKVDQITAGCTATSYCSDSSVTRGQMAIFLMRGGFNRLLPVGTAVVASVSPSAAPVGGNVTVTVTGFNTHFLQGTTRVSAGAGTTVNSITVTDANTFTVQVAVAANANPGKRTLVVTTGSEEAILPNGLTIQ